MDCRYVEYIYIFIFKYLYIISILYTDILIYLTFLGGIIMFKRVYIEICPSYSCYSVISCPPSKNTCCYLLLYPSRDVQCTHNHAHILFLFVIKKLHSIYFILQFVFISSKKVFLNLYIVIDGDMQLYTNLISLYSWAFRFPIFCYSLINPY